MDADRFATYWGDTTPRMHIPGFTHPVLDFTLEDVLEMTNYIPPKKKKQQSQYSRGGRAAGGGSYQIQPSFVDGEELGDDDGRDSHIEKNSSKSMACAVPLEERLKRMSQDEIDYDLIALLIQTILQTKNDDGSMLVRNDDGSKTSLLLLLLQLKGQCPKEQSVVISCLIIRSSFYTHF